MKEEDSQKSSVLGDGKRTMWVYVEENTSFDTYLQCDYATHRFDKMNMGSGGEAHCEESCTGGGVD